MHCQPQGSLSRGQNTSVGLALNSLQNSQQPLEMKNSFHAGWRTWVRPLKRTLNRCWQSLNKMLSYDKLENGPKKQIQPFLLILGLHQLEAKKVTWKWQNQKKNSISSRLGLKLIFEATKTVVK